MATLFYFCCLDFEQTVNDRKDQFVVICLIKKMKVIHFSMKIKIELKTLKQ